MDTTPLQIEVQSFSYKKGGIPQDLSGNGGGFVFDCRGILNPGRIDEYKTQTGEDPAVQSYLENQTEMPKFIHLVWELLDISIQDYLARGFSHLQVSFGCTGGQHRSVYSAIKIAEKIQKEYPQIYVILKHNEQPQLKQLP